MRRKGFGEFAQLWGIEDTIVFINWSFTDIIAAAVSVVDRTIVASRIWIVAIVRLAFIVIGRGFLTTFLLREPQLLTLLNILWLICVSDLGWVAGYILRLVGGFIAVFIFRILIRDIFRLIFLEGFVGECRGLVGVEIVQKGLFWSFLLGS